MQVQTQLQAALLRARSADRRLCVLIDTAPAERAHLQLDRWQVRYLSLFDDTPERSLREIAPLLLFPAEIEAPRRERLFAWLERSACAAPSVCWFETSMGPTAIADHLKQFHVVGLTAGQCMIMRWYDTRILPVWLACLTSVQASDFVGDTSAWQYVDRFGDVRPLELDRSMQVAARDPPPARSFGKPLIELDDAQYALLVDAADLTIMIARLRAVIPDEIKRVPARTLAKFVSQHQDAAATAGLNDLDRQAQYVLMALYTSGMAGEEAELKAFLKAPPEEFTAFYQGMKALSDRVWEAGPPLWVTISGTHPDDEPLVESKGICCAR